MSVTSATPIKQTLPKRGALRRDLWVVVCVKALCLFLLWFFFVRPVQMPVSDQALTQHVVSVSSSVAKET
ncbi:MAG: hypothetical protein COV52_04860 [Gammaproteobacteria bacterium CG11_big_fil_rev_8_21_14_0_20_46_22]|nr:MAG: hypothetical protein COW05_02945 [Gammaproteobacteria bacterium CG12_big_fil_rev_8_21_14_0_65_46_12]PIR11270.1 MAG: hypothetical protein COV52_04860 [Gammaproteobacteria bacterium CG11_big_fil_rev_8_21_14_0_20_46_22]